MGWGYGWAPYVPVAERRRKALQKIEKMKKKGQMILPVENVCRSITKTFWGKAWCENLEAYSDFANRLPRGRTYVRNGSVVDLQLREGQVEALVCGSALYTVKIAIHPLKTDVWKAIQKECAGKIASLVDLLSGHLSAPVMEIVTQRQAGLFPMPKEMSFSCSCPDWASMCKHVAAVLYGVGARLDHKPELLFDLRGVSHADLIYAQSEIKTAASDGVKQKMIAEDQLSEIFGIDIDTDAKDTQPKVKMKAVTPVKKKATVTKKKTVKKANIKPPKKVAAKTTTKKSQATPRPVGRPKKQVLNETAGTKQKTPVKKKETAEAKKIEKKEMQPKPKSKPAPPVKKRATVTEENTVKNAKNKPPKKATAKTTTKKSQASPRPVGRPKK